MTAPVRTPPLKGDGVRDFSGGPNFRDAPSELAKNEAVDSWNVTYDERGGAGSRLGYQKYNGTAFGGGLVSNEYYSPLLGVTITQAGASLYRGTATGAVKTFTTTGRADFAEMAGKVIAGHPVDGLFTSTDGTTWTAVSDVDAPTKVDALAVWQNKLWTNDKGGTNFARVHWSDAGDPTAWTSTSFNDLREKDNEQVVALEGASGEDITGRPGLLAFKRESTYRIDDSATGAYVTIDATIGAASNLSVVSVGQKTIALSEHGIFWTDGVGPMRDASDRFKPLWQSSQINHQKLDLFCAGRANQRAYFSLCRAGSTACDLAIEYHPEQGWLAPGSSAASCYATYGLDTEQLHAGSPTVTGQVYQQLVTGSDDGAAISWRFQTRWYELNAGFNATLWQVRLHGRGMGTMTILRDYLAGTGDSQSFDLIADLPTYDSGLLYDSGVYYAEPRSQETQPFYTLGPCRQFSLLFSGSSTTTVAGLQLLGTGTAPQLGYFAMYGVEWLYVQLGLS